MSKLTTWLIVLASSAFAMGAVIGAANTVHVVKERIKSAERPEDFQRIAKDRVFKVLIQTFNGVGGGTASLVHTKKGNVILTNKHICEASEAGIITMLEQDGKRYYTEVLRMSQTTDLCLLKIPQDLKNERAYELAPKQPEKETPVYVFGHPYLEPLTENHGRYRHEFVLPEEKNEKYVLTGIYAGRLSFFIRPGNSGSPVINSDGDLVGVVFAVDQLGGLAIPWISVVNFLNGVG